MKTSLVWIILIALTCPIIAKTERFEAADSEGVTATRDGRSIYMAVDADVKSPIKIPRLTAPLASMVWQGGVADDGISLKPEQDHWVISWKSRPAGDATLVLRFGSEPLLLEERKPIKRSADGSFYLPAHLAKTSGEQIRYEPQPFKNTVGFWTGEGDTAGWVIALDKPGRFNVAILQGCGKGQGGSTAMIGFWRPGFRAEEGTLRFEVEETGHFQNFKWRHLGEIELTGPGEVQISVLPEQIKKAALMDIRAIHLIRLPNTAKK